MNPACIALSSIDESQLTCEQLDNMGGIVPKVLFGYHEDVGTWPTLPTGSGNNALTMENGGKLTTALVMKATKAAYYFDFTDEVGSFSIAPQGDKGNISFLYQLTIINKRIRAMILGFMNAAKNRKMFFLVQDNNGTWYLMGDSRRGAMLVASDGAVTGTTPSDANQTTLTFQYVSPRALTYEISTDPMAILTPAAVDNQSPA